MFIWSITLYLMYLKFLGFYQMGCVKRDGALRDAKKDTFIPTKDLNV